MKKIARKTKTTEAPRPHLLGELGREEAARQLTHVRGPAMTASKELPVTFPGSRLSELRECLVISFNYDRSIRTFRLVTDFPKSQAEADREFLALEFSDVRMFRRELGSSSTSHDVETRYSIRGEESTIVIQSVSYNAQAASNELTLWFGPAFGGITFLFANAKGQRRAARVLETEGRFSYRDYVSGESFEFENPFDDAP